MGAGVPAHLQVTRAVINLMGYSANWFHCIGVDPAMIAWQKLVKKMRVTFCPGDYA